MQSGREDTLEERYAIKFYFKLGKNRVSGISTRTMHQMKEMKEAVTKVIDTLTQEDFH